MYDCVNTKRIDSYLLESSTNSVGEGVSDLRTDTLDSLMICEMSGVLLSIISNANPSITYDS